MTIEIKDTFTIKTKRTEHPNAGKYPGRPSMEFGTGLRNFMSDIGINNLDAFAKGEYVFEESVTAEFFDSILPGDIIGLGVLKGFNEYGENDNKGPCAYKFKILSIDRDKDVMQARNVTFEHPKRPEYTGTETELTFEDLSCGFGMGFGEILERDGKPYGVSEEIELKVKVFGDKTEEQTAPGATANVLPETTSTETNTNLQPASGDQPPTSEQPTKTKSRKTKA
jgi:hypothetical protein